MANALSKWFLSKIGGIKPSVTTPVVKDEEVLSLLAKGQKKKPVALDPFSTSDVTRQQVLESQSKVSDAFTPKANPKMTRLREVSNDMRTPEFQDDMSETYGYDRTAVNENQLQPAELIETGEISSALYRLDESFGGVKLESGAYKKLADFYSPLAVAIDDIKFPRKGLTLKQIKQKLGDEYGITTGTDTEFDKIFSKSNVERYDKETAQDLITRNAIRVEAVYMDETLPLDIMLGGIEVINDRVNTLKKNNIFDPMIPDIDTTKGFTLGVDEALNYSKYQRPGAHSDYHHNQQRRLYLETVQKYNTSALLKGEDHPSTIALFKKINKIEFATKLDSSIKPTYATIRLKLVPHKGFEELINQYDGRILKIGDGGVQHYPADTLAHARIDIVDETKLISDYGPSKFGSSSNDAPRDSEIINTFAKWRANNPNSKLNTKYVYLTEGQSDLLQSFRLDNEELLKAFRDDKELLRYHKALMKQDLFNNPNESSRHRLIHFTGVPRSVVPSSPRGVNFESNLLSDGAGIKGFGDVPLSKPELHPLPAESLTAVMKQLLQATIAYAHKNNIKQIVIPSVEQIASLRDRSIFRTPSADVRRESIDNYYKKVKQGLFFQTYDTSIRSALKKLKKDNLITTFETKTPAYNEMVLPSDTSAARRIKLKTIDQHFPIKDLMKLDNIDSRGLAKFYKNREKGLGKYRIAINKLEDVGNSVLKSNKKLKETNDLRFDINYESSIDTLEEGVREYLGLIAKLPKNLRNEFFQDDIISKNIADYRLPPNLMELNNKDFTDAIVKFIKHGTSGEGYGSRIFESGEMYGDTFKLKPIPTRETSVNSNLLFTSPAARKNVHDRLLDSTYGDLFNNPDTVMRQLIENVKYKRENLREITQAERIGEQKALVIDISKLSEKLGKQEFVLEFNKGGLVVANLQNKGLMSKSKRVAA